MSDDNLTTGEAEAWRAGWRAACAEIAAALHARAAEWARDGFRTDAEALWQARDAVRFMQPPATITNPPGRALEGKQ